MEKKYDYELIKKMSIEDYYELVKSIDNVDDFFDVVSDGVNYGCDEDGCGFSGDGPSKGFVTNLPDLGKFNLHMMWYLKDDLELDLRDIYLGDLSEYEDDYDVKNYDYDEIGNLYERYEYEIDAYDLFLNKDKYLKFLEEKIFESEDI